MVTGTSVLLALATVAPSSAAPAGRAASNWYWTSRRAESRVLTKLGIPASCRGVGEIRNGEHVALVYDQRFTCRSPRLDRTVWSSTLQVRGHHRFDITPDQEGAGRSG
jgi:hypothetical protein